MRKLEEERVEGKKTGTVRIKVRKYKGDYNGEINDEGQAHGEGTFQNQYGHVYKGTYTNNILNGYCFFEDVKTNWCRIGEIDNGVWVRATSYQQSGQIINTRFGVAHPGMKAIEVPVDSFPVFRPKEAWFGTGLPHNKTE